MVMVIAVFGATGTLGNSVARALLTDSSNFQVRAVTRDPNKPEATALADKGAVVIKADMNNRESLVPALKGADGCFVATSMQLSDPLCQQLEYQQGECVADVCMAMKVPHIVFNAQNHVSKVIGVKARHYDAKACINDYMNERELPLTSIILPFAYENFLGDFKPQKLQQQEYSIGIPMGDLSLNMLSIKQIGEAVRYIFYNKTSTVGKTFSLVGDKLTVREIASILTTHLRPHVVRDAKVTLPEFHRQNSSKPGNEDITNMFDFIHKVTQRFSIETTRKLIPDLLTFDQWAAQNKETLLKILNSY
ncbi:nmrA-like family domain-containing protein 1 [Acanthaster planci]|uniref:NmrA-like family domain-containing protein 1 n=1 Tax=Acanthaster planci TaxID=133434 RepID=A0A8B7ZNQ6_ACAPL|nr:nmrA-like family domain-containing protein 1 [Acanthaster planci]